MAFAVYVEPILVAVFPPFVDHYVAFPPWVDINHPLVFHHSVLPPPSDYPVRILSHANNDRGNRHESKIKILSRQPISDDGIVRWFPPKMLKDPRKEYFKLNVDGASKGNPGMAGIGGVIRDARSKWVVGFCKPIDATTIEAELRAVMVGIELALSMGIKFLAVELDAEYILEMLMNGTVPIHPSYNLLQECRNLMRKFEKLNLGVVYREANSVADKLSKQGCYQEHFIQFLDPQNFVKKELFDD